MATINLLLPDQNLELRALASAISALPDVQSGCRFLAAKVAAILDVSAVVVEKRGREWRVAAEAGDPPSPNVMAEAARRAEGTAAAAARSVVDLAIAGHQWTCMSLYRSGERARMLIISGDWTLSASLLQDAAVGLGTALSRLVKPVRTSAGRGMAEAWTLPRRLAVTADAIHAQQMIIDACAKAVGAEKGSLALYDAQQQALAVTATFGYSAALVKYLRFRAGDSIIGAVFRSRRPLRVNDVRQLKGGPSLRLRYRTNSFMCVPLLGANRVLGVISVTDKHDRQPFDRLDLRTLRMLAGVASLALERANALDAAKANEREAAVDSLTGLFTRRYFRTRLDEEVERARRQGSPLSLTMLDVDNFKQLNDRLGHPVGDSVLRLVGNVLRRSVRLFDVSARYGGDEFAILMPGSGPDSSRHIAQRIREGIEDSRPPSEPWLDSAKVTASVGIATLTEITADELIERADRALYTAKRDGKNCVRLWDDPSASIGAVSTGDAG